MSDRESVLKGLPAADKTELETLEKDYERTYKLLMAKYHNDPNARGIKEEDEYLATNGRFDTFESTHPKVKALDLRYKIKEEADAEHKKAREKETAAGIQEYDQTAASIEALEDKIELVEAINAANDCSAEAVHKLEQFRADLGVLQKKKNALIKKHGFALFGRSQRRTNQMIGGIKKTEKKQEALLKNANEDLSKAKKTVNQAMRSAHMGYLDEYNDYDEYSDYLDAYDGGYYDERSLLDYGDHQALYVEHKHNEWTDGEYAMVFGGLTILIVMVAVIMLICGLVCGIFIGRKYEQNKKREEPVNDSYD